VGHQRMPITVYRNGVMLRRGPFRALDDASTQVPVLHSIHTWVQPNCSAVILQAFLRDICDGFYPSELQDHFPNGVIWEVTDRRYDVRPKMIDSDRQGRAQLTAALIICSTEDYQPFRPFTGPGRAVGSRVRTLRDPCAENERPMTREELLSGLPASVIRGGRVVDVRRGLEAALAPEAGVQLVETETLKLLRDRSRARLEEGEEVPRTPRDVATIQIRGGDGGAALVIKMRFGDTIRALRSHVEAVKPDLKGSKYELRTRFPNKAYECADQTLEDAGLCPNAAMILKRL
jgi:UBX domain-containing protein 11